MGHHTLPSPTWASVTEPLVVDLSVRLCDIGARRSEIYAGVRLFCNL